MFELLIPTVLLLVLLALAVPIGFAMIVTGVIGLTLMVDLDFAADLLTTGPHASTQSYSMTTVPMFVLMALFLGESTIIKQLFRTASNWIGRWPGGLALASIATGAGVGAMSGSSIAATASLSGTTVPEMRRAGYSEPLALGAVASAGTLAPMIPPSLVLIIYGVATETSISDLFAAGIIPGLMIAALYGVVVVGWQILRPEVAPKAAKVSWPTRIRSLSGVIPSLILVIMVLGSIYSGIMTATEGGAMGAFGALLVGVVFGGLRAPGIWKAIRRTVELTASLFLIVIGAGIFTQYVTVTGITQQLSLWIQEAGIAPVMVIAIIFVLYLVLGAFLDSAGMMLLTLPVFFPLVESLGFDAIWFGIVVALACEAGLLTPPVGMNVYVTAATTGGSIIDGFKGVTPFYVAILLMGVLLVMFPGIATWLPSLSQ